MKSENDMLNKSIQEIESDYWPDQKEYVSNLVENCYNYRKIKIKDLQIHQIITLLIQDIGSEFLFPLVLDRMKVDLFEEDSYDDSSFLAGIEFFSEEIYKRNPQLYHQTMNFLKEKQMVIEAQLGWKIHNRLIQKLEKKNPAHKIRPSEIDKDL